MNWQNIAARFQTRIAEMAAEYETKLIMQNEEHDNEVAELKKKLEGKGEVVSEATS